MHIENNVVPITEFDWLNTNNEIDNRIYISVFPLDKSTVAYY